MMELYLIDVSVSIPITDDLECCLVFQYHSKGNLWKFLTTSPLIEFDRALNMAISLTQGLNYLHNIGT